MGGRGSSSATASQDLARGNGMGIEEFVLRHDGKGDDPERWSFAELTPDERQALIDQRLNKNTVFQQWLEEANDYGTATVVSRDELMALVDQGAQLITRGMPDSDRATGEYKLRDVFDDGKYYVGQGVYGDGLYFSGDRDTSASYAVNHQMPDSKNTGAVMEAVISPNARTITYGQLLKESGELDDKRISLGNGSLSAYARTKGYDVIVVNAPGGGMYYNVINRSAIIMSKDLGKASVIPGTNRVKVEY